MKEALTTIDRFIAESETNKENFGSSEITLYLSDLFHIRNRVAKGESELVVEIESLRSALEVLIPFARQAYVGGPDADAIFNRAITALKGSKVRE